jgi:hypothetical protein
MWFVSINLYTLEESYELDAKSFRTRFPLIIPFDALLSLQAFTLYPKCTFGAFSLLLQLTAESLVVYQVSPKTSFEKKLDYIIPLLMGTRIFRNRTS